MSWWKRATGPALDRGAAQRLMVTSAPPVVPAPSPHADLAGWRSIRVDQLETQLHEETVAHGETLGELRRESLRLAIAREQRDAARAVEAQTAVSWCPYCASDVECLPLGWWCDECTRANPARARDYGVRAIHDRIAYLGGCTNGDVVHAVIHDADCTVPSECSCCSGGRWCPDCAVERQRDVDLIERARVLGDEIGQRDRTAAIEGAAITLAGHVFVDRDDAYGCSCGWKAQTVSLSWPRHVAEQLAGVGALGNHSLSVKGSAPVLRVGQSVMVRAAEKVGRGWHEGHVVIDGEDNRVLRVEVTPIEVPF